MSLREGVQQLATNPKIASGVSAVTTGAGVTTVLDLIPDDIGKLATLVGIVLSAVLICTHFRVGRIQCKKIQLEIELLRTSGQLSD